MRSRCAWISNNYSRPFTLCNVWAYSFTKMNSFGLCRFRFFFSSFSLSGFYDTIDIKAIKFVRWDKYCEAFGRIACYIAIIMCAYVNIANTKRTESMDFFSLPCYGSPVALSSKQPTWCSLNSNDGTHMQAAGNEKPNETLKWGKNKLRSIY